MLFRYLCILLSLLLIACASEPLRPVWDYKFLSTQSTPSEWAADSVWTFVTAHKAGASESLTFRVTDESADTCMSGVWRKLELVEGQVASIAGIRSKAAFSVDGRFLWVSLNANWCDANDDIRGELRAARFEGERSVGGITGSSIVGSVEGWRVR